MNCYNCGKRVSNKSILEKSTSEDDVLKNIPEHVPAKCFYVDATNDQKRDLITVPACYTCNNGYSGIDDELRNAMGIANDSMIEGEQLTEKSVRALMRRKDFSEKAKAILAGTAGGFSFNRQKIYNMYVKNFKGLFYHEYKMPLPKEFNIFVLYDGFGVNPNVLASQNATEEEAESRLFNTYLMLISNNVAKHSGHRNIFEYLIQPITFDDNGEMKKAGSLQESEHLFMIQVYLQKIVVLIGAANTTLLRERQAIP